MNFVNSSIITFTAAKGDDHLLSGIWLIPFVVCSFLVVQQFRGAARHKWHTISRHPSRNPHEMLPASGRALSA